MSDIYARVIQNELLGLYMWGPPPLPTRNRRYGDPYADADAAVPARRHGRPSGAIDDHGRQAWFNKLANGESPWKDKINWFARRSQS
jgi:hypothetical protein